MADDRGERPDDGTPQPSEPARDQPAQQSATEGDAGVVPDFEVILQRAARYSAVFNGPVYTGGFAFGTSIDGIGSATRTVTDDEIRAKLQHFVGQPAGVDAAKVLRQWRLVILTGSEETGRHCGALALLTRSAPPDIVGKGPIVELEPGTTTATLLNHVFERGTRYLLTAYEPGDVTTEQLGFNLDRLRSRIAEAGAVLVMTSSPDAVSAHALAVAWQAVSGRDILNEHLNGRLQCDKETLARLQQAADGCRLSDMPTFLRILDQDGPEAVTRHFDHQKRAELRNQVSKIKKAHSLLPVVTAALLPGTDERSYERHLDQLRELFDEHGCQSPWTRNYTVTLRRSRSTRSTWVTRARRAGAPGRRVELTDSMTPELVLDVLHGQHGRELWGPVHDWLLQLPEMINDIDDEQALATGLAAYFRVDPVDARAVLDSWANNPSLSHRMVAAATVSAMCAEQAEEALRLATEWSGRSPRLQVVAAMAFGQALGRRFPVESISHLWHLCLGNVAVANAARRQFLALVRIDSEDRRIRLLLSIVTWQLEQILRPAAATEGRIGQAIDVVHALAMAELVDGVRVTSHVLRRMPDQIRNLGALWAEVLRTWRHRADGLDALRAAYGGQEPAERDVPFAELGTAVRAHLSASEWAWVCRDLDIPLWTAIRPGDDNTDAAA